MVQFDTVRRSLPVVTSAGTRFSFERGTNRAAFLSQMIAERHHLAAQRARRRAPVDEALETYDAGGRISDRRVPPGYRISIYV